MAIVRKTIGQMLHETAEKYPRGEALIHTDLSARYTYSLLLWEVERVAGGLINAGIKKGDKVALWAPNIPEWIVSMLAIAKTGALFVPVDPASGPEELRYVLGQSEARAVILARGQEAEQYVELFFSIRDQVPGVEHAFVIATETYPDTVPWTELAGSGEDPDPGMLKEREQSIEPEDPVAIMYTPGTSGAAKGVVLDHIGLINRSMASAARQGLHHEDRLCLFLPLFHMMGNTCVALSGLLIGATLVMPCLAFDPPKVLQAIHKQKCTAVYATPSMMFGLLDHPSFQKKRFATVKKGTMGGTPCPMDLMRRMLQDVGVERITVAYGITEASSWITMTYPEDPLERLVTTIGAPLEGSEVKIVDGKTGKALKPNQPGELCVRGFLMKGYYKMAGLTASVIDKKGWFHTGEIAEVDERGYVSIRGHIKGRGGSKVKKTRPERGAAKAPKKPARPPSPLNASILKKKN